MKIKVLAGETVHATTTQFRWLAKHLAGSWEWEIWESPAVLGHLGDADLFVAAGLYWRGSAGAEFAGRVPYPGVSEGERQGLYDFVARGRPVFAVHAGIASFDDWPDYGRLLGFSWHWDITTHGPIREYRVTVSQERNSLTEGVEPFSIVDESYLNVQLVPGSRYGTHLWMECGELKLPMLMTTEGGRYPGAGRAAYLALGHDMQAVQHPAFQRVVENTVRWLVGRE